MAKAPKTPDPEKTSRRKQFVETYRMAKKTDPAIGMWIAGAFVLGAVIGYVLFWLLPGEGVLGLVLSIAARCSSARSPRWSCSADAPRRRRTARWRASPVPPRRHCGC